MRIPIRYGNPWRWILPIFLLPARLAYIRIDGDLGPGAHGVGVPPEFPKGSVESVSDHRPVVSIGAHGWNGRWLVNGAHRPIATIALSPPARRACSAFQSRSPSSR